MPQKIDTAKFFEIARYACLCVGIFVAYLVGGGDATKTLHYLSFLVVISMAGLTGIEGMFFGASSARSMGREPSPEYQKQSAGGNLALAITAIIVFAMDWGAFADATILIATLLFFIFSAGVHTWDAVANKNMSVKNIMRPVLTLLIVGVCIWPLAWGIV